MPNIETEKDSVFANLVRSKPFLTDEEVEQKIRARDEREFMERVDKSLMESRLPARYRRGEKSLDSFVAGTDEALTAAFTLAEDWAENGRPSILFFTGDPGLGKTHLAASALARRIRKTGEVGYFATVADLLAEARGLPDQWNAQGSVTRRYMRAPNLVLDDLGAERLSEWGIAILAQIVNERYETNARTIVTSNFTLEELAERIAVAGEEVAARRIVDRLWEMTGGRSKSGRVVLRGKSFRQK